MYVSGLGKSGVIFYYLAPLLHSSYAYPVPKRRVFLRHDPARVVTGPSWLTPGRIMEVDDAGVDAKVEGFRVTSFFGHPKERRGAGR